MPLLLYSCCSLLLLTLSTFLAFWGPGLPVAPPTPRCLSAFPGADNLFPVLLLLLLFISADATVLQVAWILPLRPSLLLCLWPRWKQAVMDIREAWASPGCLAAWSAKKDRDAALSSSPLAVPASSSLLPPSHPQTLLLSVLQHNTLPLSTSYLRSRIQTLRPPPCLFLSSLMHPHPCFPLNMVSSQLDVPYLAPGSKAQTISAALGEKKNRVIKQKMHWKDQGYEGKEEISWRNWKLLGFICVWKKSSHSSQSLLLGD